MRRKWYKPDKNATFSINKKQENQGVTSENGKQKHVLDGDQMNFLRFFFYRFFCFVLFFIIYFLSTFSAWAKHHGH